MILFHRHPLAELRPISTDSGITPQQFNRLQHTMSKYDEWRRQVQASGRRYVAPVVHLYDQAIEIPLAVEPTLETHPTREVLLDATVARLGRISLAEESPNLDHKVNEFFRHVD